MLQQILLPYVIVTLSFPFQLLLQYSDVMQGKPLAWMDIQGIQDV